MVYENSAPEAKAAASTKPDDLPRSRSFSARPKPNGTKSKTFKNASGNPPPFPLLPKRNGDAPCGSKWKLKRNGYMVKNRIPAVASSRIRFDQLEAGES